MFDSFASFIDWVSANKEWLFNGIGLALLSLLGSAIVLVGRLGKNRSLPKGPQKSTTRSQAAVVRQRTAASSLHVVFTRFCRWIVESVRAIRRHFVEKYELRKRRLYQEMRETTVFFSDRFADAFPGCRHVLVINDPAETLRRLDILLQKPLSIEIEAKRRLGPALTQSGGFGAARMRPRRSYRRIRNYFLMPTDDILFIGVELHRVRRVVAFGSTSSRAKVVYVETDGVPPSGLYGDGSSEYARERGYRYEEVGVYRGRFIRREELMTTPRSSTAKWSEPWAKPACRCAI